MKDAEDIGLSRFTYFQNKLILRVAASAVHARRRAGLNSTTGSLEKEGNFDTCDNVDEP